LGDDNGQGDHKGSPLQWTNGLEQRLRGRVGAVPCGCLWGSSFAPELSHANKVLWITLILLLGFCWLFVALVALVALVSHVAGVFFEVRRIQQHMRMAFVVYI